MSSGAYHYRKAEEILADLDEIVQVGMHSEAVTAASARALAHSTLAQAAATVNLTWATDSTEVRDDWIEVTQ